MTPKMQETMETKRRWKFRFFVLFLVLAVAGLTVYIVRTYTYTATAYIQILSQKPCFIFNDTNQPQNYDNYVNTQFALMKSPLILEKTLEAPEISKLPCILRQKDKAAYLAKKLKLKAVDNSEIVTVSFTSFVPEDAAKIVNAVVNTFFDYDSTQNQDWNIRLLTQLNLELDRQKAIAKLLETEIRTGMGQAAQQAGGNGLPNAGSVVGEKILQEIHQSELKLDFLRAELNALRESSPNRVLPWKIQAAVENDSDWKYLHLHEKKKELKRQADLVKDFPVQGNMIESEGDKLPTSGFQDQIENLDREIEKKYAEIVEAKRKELTALLAEKQEQSIADKETEIRTREIYINQLQRRYKEQMKETANRTVHIVDVSFQVDQLQRVKEIQNQLESRILALEAERNAPNQIQLKKKAVVPCPNGLTRR